ncbi:hypothetical protein [Oricola indica]|jgi:hypothetical protein|uniref:hypothetical protein n=1 Tax=Oricola indica TaxID=2872591 RepID=UPI001CBB7A3E|nr:hypothetical protein [Oricola indica]
MAVDQNLVAAKVAEDLLAAINRQKSKNDEFEKSILANAALVTETARALTEKITTVIPLKEDLAKLSPRANEVAAVAGVAEAVDIVSQHVDLVQSAAGTLDAIHVILLQIAADYADLAQKYAEAHAFDE